jgi:pimeloyl-ACP methyl ester carboxylesterase
METDDLVTASSGARLHVRTLGVGSSVLFIPSLGRGVGDFAALARAAAEAGFRAVLPEPRGIGRSTGPPPDDLFDLASDVAATIEALDLGPTHLIGHAFGNRVARAASTARPDLTASVVLLAGGGEATPAPEISAAVRGAVAEGIKPDSERLQDIARAFFVAGHDPAIWLHGWWARAAAAQGAAVRATATNLWWRAGEAPLLFVQALEDPVAPAENADSLARQIGPRLTRVDLAHASHAILPEQPTAVAAVVTAWLKGERRAESLQSLADRLVIAPPPLPGVDA